MGSNYGHPIRFGVSLNSDWTRPDPRRVPCPHAGKVAPAQAALRPGQPVPWQLRNRYRRELNRAAHCL